MFKNFSIVPKFFILLLDLGATLLALFIAILIQFNVTFKLINWGNVINAMVLITLINSLVFIVTKSYTGIVRYTGVQDALRILIAIASSSLATEWLKGKSVDEAVKIDNMDLVEELNLPPVKIHCSVLAEDAIKSAINDYRVKNGLEAIVFEEAKH